MPKVIEESDVAATLREIAANADAMSGKILRECTKAANKGLENILYVIPYNDALFLKYRKQRPDWSVPPYIEKLESLGFNIGYESSSHWFYGWDRLMKVSW